MSDTAMSATALSIAEAVRSGALTARAAVEASLDAVRARNDRLNAFTDLTEARALARADALDGARGRGEPLPPLAGVPFAVKNLFDVAGLPTRAGSLINREAAPADRDAAAIRRLERAGAVLVGTLNMGEYAYDFTGENAHDGASRNPHDPERMSGGSSGGSGSAVAAGLVPVALGSDTNGSIRVPASLCGVFGLKPTFGRVSRAGTFPFVASLDHVGPLARSVADLAAFYDVLQGHDPEDPVSAAVPAEPVQGALGLGIQGLRIAVADGYFRQGTDRALAAVDQVAAALGATRHVAWPEAERARSAAFLITAIEGATLHLDRLRRRPHEFDPEVRDRLLAAAMAPGAWYVRAQKVRAWYRARVRRLFEEVDAVLAPATPCTAPRLGQKTFVLDGAELPVRANLGLYTQPISFIGLPVCTVPVWGEGESLPIGVQIIAPSWREDVCLRVAAELERRDAVRAPAAA